MANSYTLAEECWPKAAVQGDYTAQCSLGTCYEFGRGLPKSNSLAVEWYRKAAIQGCEQAKDRLEQLLLLPGCSKLGRSFAV